MSGLRRERHHPRSTERAGKFGEGHPHHRSQRVAGASRPPRLLKIADQARNLRGVEESCKRARRARWYRLTCHSSLYLGLAGPREALTSRGPLFRFLEGQTTSRVGRKRGRRNANRLASWHGSLAPVLPSSWPSVSS